MFASDRARWMLGILLVLASVRFLLLPWIDWQAERHDELVVVTKRLDKALGVIDARVGLLAAEKKLESINRTNFGGFPTYESRDAARLEIQRSIEGVIRTGGAQTEIFVWLSEGGHESSGLYFQRGRVAFRGALRDLAGVQAALETGNRHLIFREVTASFDNLAPTADEAVGRLTIVMDAHYRLGNSAQGALQRVASAAVGG